MLVPHSSIAMEEVIPISNKIFSNRLLLRKLECNDLQILLNWSSNADAYGDFLSPEFFEKEDIEQKYASGFFWNYGEKFFLIEKKDGQAIGTLHYWIPVDKTDTAVAAVKIAEPTERNKGYGTEAQKSLIIYLFEKVKIKFVEMYTDLDNLAQHRCLQKLGFSMIETLTYDDRGISRTGNLFRINNSQFSHHPIYRYHYE